MKLQLFHYSGLLTQVLQISPLVQEQQPNIQGYAVLIALQCQVSSYGTVLPVIQVTAAHVCRLSNSLRLSCIQTQLIT